MAYILLSIAAYVFGLLRKPRIMVHLLLIYMLLQAFLVAAGYFSVLYSSVLNDRNNQELLFKLPNLIRMLSGDVLLIIIMQMLLTGKCGRKQLNAVIVMAAVSVGGFIWYNCAWIIRYNESFFDICYSLVWNLVTNAGQFLIAYAIYKGEKGGPALQNAAPKELEQPVA